MGLGAMTICHSVLTLLLMSSFYNRSAILLRNIICITHQLPYILLQSAVPILL